MVRLIQANIIGLYDVFWVEFFHKLGKMKSVHAKLSIYRTSSLIIVED